MTSTARRALLIMTIVLMAAFLVAWFANPAAALDANRPDDLPALGPYLADHPADWLAAAAISDQALDSSLPRRFELWRGAFAHGMRMAPRRPNAQAAFARAGLFHWYELGPADRTAVLRTTAPLLRDPGSFGRMYKPLWELTGDFEYLRANAPDRENAIVALRELAAMHGRFTEYRELRDRLVKKRMDTFRREHHSRTPAELLALVPSKPSKADEPLVRAVVGELRRRPLAAERASMPRAKLHEIIAFATRHDISLAGLDAISGDHVPSPQSAAVNEWEGFCGRREICRAATATLSGPASITIQNAQSDEVAPYVEIYVDDALVAEGAVEDARRFDILGDAGQHRVEVRLVNPWTRNRIQRRVRLS